MSRHKTLPLNQWALRGLNIRPQQKDRFDRIFKGLKADKKVMYASELFEQMLSAYESKFPVSGLKGKPGETAKESIHA
jgi:hypothetical protein